MVIVLNMLSKKKFYDSENAIQSHFEKKNQSNFSWVQKSNFPIAISLVNVDTVCTQLYWPKSTLDGFKYYRLLYLKITRNVCVNNGSLFESLILYPFIITGSFKRLRRT